jgi:oligosaccharyltransferase complex subunit epsilon
MVTVVHVSQLVVPSDGVRYLLGPIIVHQDLSSCISAKFREHVACQININHIYLLATPVDCLVCNYLGNNRQSHSQLRIMAKKPATPVAAAKPSPVGATKPSPQTTRQPSTSASVPPVKAPTSTTLSPRSSPQDIALHVWNRYLQDTPPRTLLLDVFLAFIALNGAVQFVYCILAGNYVSYTFITPIICLICSSPSTPSSQDSEHVSANSSSPSPYECKPQSDPLPGLRVPPKRPLPRQSTVSQANWLMKELPRSVQRGHSQILSSEVSYCMPSASISSTRVATKSNQMHRPIGSEKLSQ